MCITDSVRAGTTDPNPLNDKGGICTAKK